MLCQVIHSDFDRASPVNRVNKRRLAKRQGKLFSLTWALTCKESIEGFLCMQANGVVSHRITPNVFGIKVCSTFALTFNTVFVLRWNYRWFTAIVHLFFKVRQKRLKNTRSDNKKQFRWGTQGPRREPVYIELTLFMETISDRWPWSSSGSLTTSNRPIQ